MTIYEQIKKVMEGRNGMVVTSGFMKSELNRRFGVDVNSVLPSDFCYNRINDGIHFRKDNRIFRYIDKNAYEYLGENYPYTGDIVHKPQRSTTEKVVGHWVNGNLKYPL